MHSLQKVWAQRGRVIGSWSVSRQMGHSKHCVIRPEMKPWRLLVEELFAGDGYRRFPPRALSLSSSSLGTTEGASPREPLVSVTAVLFAALELRLLVRAKSSGKT